MLFLLPNIIGFAVFVAAPVVFSLVMAFTNWDLAQREPFGFVGFENFEFLQTLTRHPKYSNDSPEEPVEGYDRGDYVAIRARKP